MDMDQIGYAYFNLMKVGYTRCGDYFVVGIHNILMYSGHDSVKTGVNGLH